MVETVRYTYRLRPGRQAQAALLAEWSRCRWLWNEAVHQRKSGREPKQTLRTYMTSPDASFTVKGRGRPKVKLKKNSLPSLEYTRNGFTIKDGRLRLAKGVTLPVVWSRELPSDPTSVRVYQDSLGHWYASFVVQRDPAAVADPDLPGIGVDWGVTTTATTTDPAFDLPHLGHRKRCAAALAKAQRTMARRRRPKGRPASKGYQTAKRQAARIAKKAARQNTHDARVWAKTVVDHHHLIAVEDFKPTFLARSTMARKAADAAIGACKRELIDRS
ncbi:RNA-guided endonuclease TnpB family protein, partial [Actinoplanes campanulatus]